MTQDRPPFVADDSADEGASSAPHPPGAIDTLKKAMRRARQDNAERAGALSELRSARLGRLELLQEALKPLVAQIPPDIDTFDIGLMPGANPRLFIDMIGFVEMGRDARVYRLVQDTRHGRTAIAESEDIETMIDAVTDYVARRMLERDKALAADARYRTKFGGSIDLTPPRGTVSPSKATAYSMPATSAGRRTAGPFGWMSIAFAFLIDLFGSIAFFAMLAAIGWYLWNRFHISA